MAELLALFLDHGTTLRTWAQGSGYEIAGSWKTFSEAKCSDWREHCWKGFKRRKRYGHDQQMWQRESRYTCSSPLSEDWKYLNLYALNEDQKELLGRPKKPIFQESGKEYEEKNYDVKPDTPRKKYPFPSDGHDIVMMLDDSAMQTAGSKTRQPS